MFCVYEQVAIKYVGRNQYDEFITTVSKLTLFLRYYREAIKITTTS